MKIGIAAFTDAGMLLLRRIAAPGSGEGDEFAVYDKNGCDIKSWLGRQFYECDALIFIGAAGIATRLIAPLIVSKDRDPAVIVVDERARFVIPVLSGHLGGANRLAARLAGLLSAVPVITTATDINGVFAVDVWSGMAGCVIDDVSKVKYVSAALLSGRTVGFYSDFEVTGARPDGLCMAEHGSIGVCVSLDAGKKPFETTLNVLPKILTLGAGCKKNVCPEDFEHFVFGTLDASGLSIKCFNSLASIDLKKNEQCLIEFSKKYDLEFKTFSSAELSAADDVLDGSGFIRSEFVRSVTGVDNVCERSAVLRSGGRLLVPKTVGNGIALAVAAPDWECVFN